MVKEIAYQEKVIKIIINSFTKFNFYSSKPQIHENVSQFTSILRNFQHEGCDSVTNEVRENYIYDGLSFKF